MTKCIYTLRDDEGPYLSVNGRHAELHVAVGDIGLTEVEAAAAQELLTDGGEGAVTSYNEVGLDLLLGTIGPRVGVGGHFNLTFNSDSITSTTLAQAYAVVYFRDYLSYQKTSDIPKLRSCSH